MSTHPEQGDVVALLLDDAMTPARLGKLLRDARKRRGWTRQQAAKAAGIKPGRLRDYERGAKDIPAPVCERLAEEYGDDLAAHVPVRVPLRADADWLVVGPYEDPLMTGSPDEVIRDYITIVKRLRKAKGGAPLALRAGDLVTLAAALGTERDDIEARIAEALGCSREEARALHREMLRRRVVLPVAGLAAGVAAMASVAYAQPSTPSTGTAPQHNEVLAASTVTPPAHLALVQQHASTSANAPAASSKPHHTAAAPAPSPPQLPAPATRLSAPPVLAPPAAPFVVPAPSQPAAKVTDATVPPAEEQAEVPHAAPAPRTYDVHVLPGETPITIIDGNATP